MEKQLRALRIEIIASKEVCLEDLRNARNEKEIFRAYYTFRGAMVALRCVNMEYFRESYNLVTECYETVHRYIFDNIGGDLAISIIYD